MSLLQVTIFSLVEGITEFLPVSSTGHLILTADLLGLAQTDVQKSFEIAIQLGAILAVVLLYGRALLKDVRTMQRVAVAFIPTAVIGFLLHGIVKRLLLGNTSVVLWSLLIGGIILIVFERFRPVRSSTSAINKMTYGQAVLVGACQSIAIIPGVSRSAATIVGGELMGVSRSAIVEFSFLLAIPTMAAATAYDLWKSAGEFTLADIQSLAIGFILSFLVAFIAIRWFLAFIKNHSFVSFGVYRIVIAIAGLLLLL